MGTGVGMVGAAGGWVGVCGACGAPGSMAGAAFVSFCSSTTAAARSLLFGVRCVCAAPHPKNTKETASIILVMMFHYDPSAVPRTRTPGEGA